MSPRPRRWRPPAELLADGPLLPPGWRPDPAGHLRLGEGTLVSLRPFRPGDGGLLVAGFARMSPQSRYRRFLTPVPRLTDSMLAFLTSVDDANHHAWGAMVDEPDGEFGAGVVRWVRSKADPAVADMAVTVIDDYQGRGLGGLLLDVAVLDAFAFGVDRFEGTVLSENVASRRMLARGGATFRPDGGGVLAFTLPLRPRVDLLDDEAPAGAPARLPPLRPVPGSERVRRQRPLTGLSRSFTDPEFGLGRGNSHRLVLKYRAVWSDHPDRGYPHVWEDTAMADNELLTPSEVAVMFKVNPKTVTRWARAGKISAVRTLGGHRRFRASEIRRFLTQVEELGA